MSAEVLEKLTFAILEEMGAVALEWRSPRQSIKAPDGVETLSSVSISRAPDGDIERRQW